MQDELDSPMNFTPAISVIVPLFKTEAYVERCLRSIMRQTFSDFEIVCVDDCSPDDSAGIVLRLAEEDPRIRLVRHETNLGLGGARNTGIRAARGAYLASVDSDDHIAETMLEALWEGAEGGRFDVVVCGYEDVTSEGEVLATHQTAVKALDPIPPEQSPFRISNPAFWNKLWRRSLFVDNDIFFPNHIYYQDSATTPRIYKKARNVNFIGGVHYKYHIRSDSVTNLISDKHVLDKFRELDVVKDFLLREGLYEAHGADFRERVFNSYKYHAENVVANRVGGEAATDRYLRHLLLMRESYLVLDDVLRSLSPAEKASALRRRETILDYEEARAAFSTAPPAEPAPPRLLPDRPRVLVLTLYSGENEFGRCRAALASQLYTNWEQKVFEGLGNQEAHQTLYETIMEARDRYDLFLKLDADMMFASVYVLDRLVNKFKSTPDLDHFVVACDDFMTGKPIIGVHAFSNRVSWTPNVDGLFLDPSPQRPGRRVVERRPRRSYFLHSPDPSPFQAFHFGAHRALKLVQRGRPAAEKRTEAIRTQWLTLQDVWDRFAAEGDRRHALALFAAERVVDGTLGDAAHDYRDPTLKEVFAAAETLSTEEIRATLVPLWGDDPARQAYFERAVGPAGLAKLAVEAAMAPQEEEDEAPAARLGRVVVPPIKSFRDLYEAGREAFRAGDYAEALLRMELAALRKSSSKLARLGQAEALIGLGRIDDAAALYAELTRLWPSDGRLARRLEALKAGSSGATPRMPEPMTVSG